MRQSLRVIGLITESTGDGRANVKAFKLIDLNTGKIGCVKSEDVIKQIVVDGNNSIFGLAPRVFNKLVVKAQYDDGVDSEIYAGYYIESKDAVDDDGIPYKKLALNFDKLKDDYSYCKVTFDLKTVYNQLIYNIEEYNLRDIFGYVLDDEYPLSYMAVGSDSEGLYLIDSAGNIEYTFRNEKIDYNITNIMWSKSSGGYKGYSSSLIDFENDNAYKYQACKEVKDLYTKAKRLESLMSAVNDNSIFGYTPRGLILKDYDAKLAESLIEFPKLPSGCRVLGYSEFNSYYKLMVDVKGRIDTIGTNALRYKAIKLTNTKNLALKEIHTFGLESCDITFDSGLETNIKFSGKSVSNSTFRVNNKEALVINVDSKGLCSTAFDGCTFECKVILKAIGDEPVVINSSAFTRCKFESLSLEGNFRFRNRAFESSNIKELFIYGNIEVNSKIKDGAFYAVNIKELYIPNECPKLPNKLMSKCITEYINITDRIKALHIYESGLDSTELVMAVTALPEDRQRNIFVYDRAFVYSKINYGDISMHAKIVGCNVFEGSYISCSTFELDNIDESAEYLFYDSTFIIRDASYENMKVNRIAKGMFKDCNVGSSLVMNCNNIPDEAFLNFKGKVTIITEGGIERIGKSAFEGVGHVRFDTLDRYILVKYAGAKAFKDAFIELGSDIVVNEYDPLGIFENTLCDGGHSKFKKDIDRYEDLESTHITYYL